MCRVFFVIRPLVNSMGKKQAEAIDEGERDSFIGFLAHEGAFLSSAPEFLVFFALPYMANPKENPQLKPFLTRSWVMQLRKKIESFWAAFHRNSGEFHYTPVLEQLFRSGKSTTISCGLSNGYGPHQGHGQHSGVFRGGGPSTAEMGQVSLLNSQLKGMNNEIQKIKREEARKDQEWQVWANESVLLTRTLLKLLRTSTSHPLSPFERSLAKLEQFPHLKLNEEIVCMSSGRTNEVLSQEDLQKSMEMADYRPTRDSKQADKTDSSKSIGHLGLPLDDKRTRASHNTQNHNVIELKKQEKEINYSKIKEDLRKTKESQTKLELLKALRVSLVFSERLSDLHQFLRAFIEQDFLEIRGSDLNSEPIFAFLLKRRAESEPVIEEFLKMLIALASCHLGRSYLSQGRELFGVLVGFLREATLETDIGRICLVLLQKLSIRTAASLALIHFNVVPFIVRNIDSYLSCEEPFYAEYLVGLLMNITFYKEGKEKCEYFGDKLIDLLMALLENQKDKEAEGSPLRSFIHGTLYFLLDNHSMRVMAIVSIRGLDKLQ